MRAGMVCLRGMALVALIALLPSCAPGAFPGFGIGNCRTVYVLSGGVVQPVNSCGGVSREGLMALGALPAVGSDLTALLTAPKFEPDAYYGGAEGPQDKAALTQVVNDAIKDLAAMPAPKDAMRVRQRLQSAVVAVGRFAPEDQAHAHMYLVLAWRASGFMFESALFPRPDDEVVRAF